jgi:hypothetical protein
MSCWKQSSGTKYAVIIRSRCCADSSMTRKTVAMSFQPTLALPRETCTHEPPSVRSCSGKRRERSIRSWPVSAQFCANAADSPSTAGPVTRTCVSRHSCSLRASPHHSSAMPTPPVKPTTSSHTRTLRCVRWLCLSGESSRPCQTGEPEPLDLHPGGGHPLQQGRLHEAPADGVDEDADGDAGTGALGQRRRELLRDVALPVGEGQQVDGAGRAADLVQHRGEDLVAVAQDGERVALRRRDAEQPLQPAAQLLDPVGLVRTITRALAAGGPSRPCSGDAAPSVSSGSAVVLLCVVI